MTFPLTYSKLACQSHSRLFCLTCFLQNSSAGGSIASIGTWAHLGPGDRQTFHFFFLNIRRQFHLANKLVEALDFKFFCRCSPFLYFTALTGTPLQIVWLAAIWGGFFRKCTQWLKTFVGIRTLRSSTMQVLLFLQSQRKGVLKWFYRSIFFCKSYGIELI